VRGKQVTAAPIIFILLLAGSGQCVAQPNDSTETPQSEAVPASVELLVYKKWIGAGGYEANVEIHLSCRSEDQFEPKFINLDKPDGWQVANVPPDGVLCSVREIEKDTFVADVADCLDLLVLPEQEAECTIVNTKVVKRIDMLNRYGLIIMIAVMLGAGLAGVRGFGGKM